MYGWGMGDTIPVIVTEGGISATANLPAGGPVTVSSLYGDFTGQNVTDLVNAMAAEEASSISASGAASWLSSHASMVLVGAAVFIGALFLTGGRRR